MSATLKKRGICHVFGDGVPHDEGIMAFKYAIERVTDTKVLIPRLFEQVDPTFASRVKPGDIVIAGKDFGKGKPHNGGYLAMATLGMGVICESMPHKSLRRAVAVGLPILVGCADARSFALNGDEIEVDFTTGEARNLRTGATRKFPALPPILGEIVVAGGAAGAMRAWLESHPDQKEGVALAAERVALMKGTPVKVVAKADA
jgi:3-isopropylmalate/(R)-2-methylmalate dehydratase small subunit